MDRSAPAEDVSRSGSSRSPLLRWVKKNNSAPTPRSATRSWVGPASYRRAFSKRRRCCTPAATAPAACRGHDLGRRGPRPPPPAPAPPRLPSPCPPSSPPGHGSTPTPRSATRPIDQNVSVLFVLT